MGFQSTLSLRRATLVDVGKVSEIENFNPRSPCGERREYIPFLSRIFLISIHALLAESDPPTMTTWSLPSNFNPRSPCGERHFRF